MIDSFSFGTMVIEGETYQSDLFIYPDGRVKAGWRRKSGHRLSYGDISDLTQGGIEVIVAGKGVSGRMEPDEDIHRQLQQRGIEFIALPNDEAVVLYNRLSTKRRVAACFHLTC
jgi:hypothetical protein